MLLPQPQGAGCGLPGPCPEGHLVPRARPSSWPLMLRLSRKLRAYYAESQTSAELPPGPGTGATLDSRGVGGTWSNSRSATTSFTSLPPRECPGPGAAEDLPWKAQVQQYLETSEQEAAPQQGGRDGLPTGFIPGVLPSRASLCSDCFTADGGSAWG